MLTKSYNDNAHAAMIASQPRIGPHAQQPCLLMNSAMICTEAWRESLIGWGIWRSDVK